MRTQRASSGTTYTYIYDGSSLAQMTVGSNTLVFAYGAYGHPMAVKYNGTYYYYATNAFGDVVAIADGAGNEVVTYNYDAWGNILSTGGTMADTLGEYNPLRYRGYVYDQETGLYYLQSRYYNPAICRFISADSIGFLGADGTFTSYNLFAYCGNNPILYKSTSVGDGSLHCSQMHCINSVTSGTQQPANLGVMFTQLASSFAIADQWIGYLNGGAESGVRFWGPGGIGAPALQRYSNGVASIGKGMAVAGFAFDIAVSLIENFNNSNLSTAQKYGVSLLDVTYYVAKHQAVYLLSNESIKLAISVGAATVGTIALDTGLYCALVIGGATAVLVGVGAAVAIYFISEGADMLYGYFKSMLFS